MFRRLYRQRRRIVFLTAMIFISVLIYSIDNPDLRYQLKHDFAGPTWIKLVSIVLAIVLIVLAFCVAILLLFPSARRVFEVFGVSAVLFELVRFLHPVLPEWASEGTASWLTFVGIFLLINAALERDLFFQWGLNTPLRASTSRIIAATPEAIWAATAPDADTIGTYWTRALLKVIPRPDVGQAVVETHYRLGTHGTLVQLQTRRIWNKPKQFLYDYAPEDIRDPRHSTPGSLGMTCEPLLDGRTRVTLQFDFPKLGLGTASLLWLDDVAASEMDAIAARITGRRDWSIAGWAARKMAGA